MNSKLVNDKPLKRLDRFFPPPHRAKAAVLVREARALALMCLVLNGRPVLATAAEAAETSVPTLTLEALVADTLANNPELNFYKAEIAAAKGERQTAGAWANPEVAGTAGSKRSVAPGASGEGLAWSVTVRQTFDWP